MEMVTALLIGVGLSAACGFRVFVPLLVMGIAQRSGQLELAENMLWITSTPALVALSAATVLEVGGYYVPWVDNMLDAVATPAAFIAGTLVTAAAAGQVYDMSPYLQWGIGIIAGGGSATIVQGTTVVARAVSSVTTGGIGNPIVSTAEAATSTVLSILAIVLPIIVAVLLIILTIMLGIWIFRPRPRNMATLETSGSPKTSGGVD